MLQLQTKFVVLLNKYQGTNQALYVSMCNVSIKQTHSIHMIQKFKTHSYSI